MNYLNGIEEEPVAQATNYKAAFWKILPNAIDEKSINAIEKRIELMNRNYDLYIRRNRVLAAIAMLETEVKNLEDEIKRL